MKKVIISLAVAMFFLSGCACNNCCGNKAAEGEAAATEEVCDSTKACCGKCEEGKTCENCENCENAEKCEHCQKSE